MTHYKINYGNMTSLRQRIKMCYAFLTMDWGFQPEVSIVTGKSKFDGETTYSKLTAPTFKDFFKEYCQYRKGIHGIVGFDQSDEKKIGITLLPETDNQGALCAGRPLIMLTDYSDSPESVIGEFLDELYTSFDKAE